MVRENSKLGMIKASLESLELGQKICRIEIMNKCYDMDGTWVDEFRYNSFRVTLTNAKKLIPEKKFVTIDAKITRIL